MFDSSAACNSSSTAAQAYHPKVQMDLELGHRCQPPMKVWIKRAYFCCVFLWKIADGATPAVHACVSWQTPFPGQLRQQPEEGRTNGFGLHAIRRSMISWSTDMGERQRDLESVARWSEDGGEMLAGNEYPTKDAVTRPNSSPERPRPAIRLGSC
jgi:hypothetical protein